MIQVYICACPFTGASEGECAAIDACRMGGWGDRGDRKLEWVSHVPRSKWHVLEPLSAAYNKITIAGILQRCEYVEYLRNFLF